MYAFERGFPEEAGGAVRVCAGIEHGAYPAWIGIVEFLAWWDGYVVEDECFEEHECLDDRVALHGSWSFVKGPGDAGVMTLVVFLYSEGVWLRCESADAACLRVEVVSSVSY